MRLAESPGEARIANLESRLEQLQARIESLEEGRRRENAGVFDSEPLSLMQQRSREAETAEYWIGAKLIPRFGAILVIVAIAIVAFLEASKSSGLSRAMLLAAETLLCLGFVAVGELKRNELEGFGQTLAAIGSCGLYLTAGGAHFAYGAVTGSEMAAGFAILTILNHAYAAWRSTRLFFAIGAAGGAAAMLFPLAQQDFSLALGIYTAVTLAGAAACAVRKWLHLAIVGWLFGLAVLIPVIDSEQSRLSVLAAMYLGSLGCIAASAWAYGRQRLDALALGPPFALFATAMVGLWVISGPAAIGHLAVLSALAAGAALLLPKEDPARRSLLIGSAGVLFALSPMCGPPDSAVYIYSGLVWGACALGRVTLPKLAAVFGLAALGLAALTCLRAQWEGLGREGPWMLGSLSAALPASWLSFRRASWGWLNYAVASVGVLAVWWTFQAEAAWSAGGAFSLLTIVLTLYALVLLTAGFRVHCATLRMWSFVAMLAVVLQVLSLGQTVTAGFKLGALLSVGLMMLAGGYRYVHDRRLPDKPHFP